MSVPQTSFCVVRRRYRRYLWLYLLATCLLLSSSLLISCSGPNIVGGGSTPTAKPTPSEVVLTKLHWCNKPFILFRDLHAPVTVTATGTPGGTPTTEATTGSTPGATATTMGGTPTATVTATTSPTAVSGPTTLTDWSQIKPNLGFTVYLPAMLPRNTCLVSASGTVHDPIFGGNFIIGYLLPNRSPLSFSEAPLRTANQSHDFQCTSPKGDRSPGLGNADIALATPSGASTPALTPTPSETPILLCTGARANTNIVFSSRGSQTSLKQFFDALQPNVAWVPAS